MQEKLYPPKRIVWHSAADETFQALIGRCGNFQSIWREQGCRLAPGKSLLLDFGREITGGVRILQGFVAPRLEDERSVAVRLRFGESVIEAMTDPNNQHAIHDVHFFLPSMGEMRFGNSGFRYVRIDNEDPEFPLDLQECSAYSYAHGKKRIGTFRSSDPLLNQIWDGCADTLDACISPLMVDGAKRDRLVWMGDLFGEIRAACTLYGKHPSIAKTLDFILAESLPGKTFNGIPGYLPYWFMSQLEYYRFCRDDAYLQKQKKLFIVLAEYLFEDYLAHPDRVFAGPIVDWSNDTKSNHGYPALYAVGCRAAGAMAKLLKLPVLEAQAQTILAGLKQQIRIKDLSKAAAAQACAAGILAPDEIYRQILSSAPETGLSTFHFDPILTAYSRAGKTPAALKLLRRYYGGMLSLGAITFWEQFDPAWLQNGGRIDELPRPGQLNVHQECGSGCFKGTRNSLCHGWAAAPVAWITEEILGLKCLAPGFASVSVRPALCDLEWVEGVCPTPFGEIMIRQEKGREIAFTLPPGITVK